MEYNRASFSSYFFVLFLFLFPRTNRLHQWKVAQDILDLAAAGAGGTIGVIGTLGALEMKKREIKQRAECPYCASSGHLTCAGCLGVGTVRATSSSNFSSRQSCPRCEGTGSVTCVNCKGYLPVTIIMTNLIIEILIILNDALHIAQGDGRLVPVILDTALSRDPESELEDIGMA